MRILGEIEIGLWDNYLFYDYESFMNIRAQHNLANVVQNMLMMNQQQANDRNNQVEVTEANNKNGDR